jgi:Undecaprenyl-phosphate galactose phosphotransferase WbaP
MEVRSGVDTEVIYPVVRTSGTMPRKQMLARSRVTSGSRTLVVLGLIAADVLLALVLCQMAALIQFLWGSGALTTVAIAGMVPNVVVWLGLRFLLGLYPGYGLGQVEELRRQTFALFTTLAITTVFAFFSSTAESLSRMLLFAWILGLLVTAPLARYCAKLALKKLGLWGKPVVVLGAHDAGARVLEDLRREWQLGFRPMAVFDNRVAPIQRTLNGVPYGGTLGDAIALGREHRIDTVIFAMPYTRREQLARFVDLAKLNFRHVVVIPNLVGITNSAVVARNFAGTFGVEIKYNLLDPWSQRLKRALDLAATVVGGIFVLPLIAALALLVRLESRGPIFYSDKRMGRDGELFSCVKFRTMVPDAESLLHGLLAENEEAREEYLKYHKLRNDPRVTSVGRFLRKTSLDELPQLWNVLRGEMSLVGPRPYLPRESGDIGVTQDEILRVTPGITGPWQVAGRNRSAFEERVEMDVSYVADWSVWLDIVLLVRTSVCVLFSRGAY